MANEAALWGVLKRSVPLRYTARRVEARHPAGISDVMWAKLREGQSTLVGWLELKDDEMTVRPEQGIFLRDMWNLGVPSAVLARRGQMLHLFAGDVPYHNRLIVADAAFTYLAKRFDPNQLWEDISNLHMTLPKEGVMTDEMTFEQKVSATMTLATKVKKALKDKGLRRGRTKCPVCGGWVTGVLAGKRDHLHMACETKNCIWMME